MSSVQTLSLALLLVASPLAFGEDTPIAAVSAAAPSTPVSGTLTIDDRVVEMRYIELVESSSGNCPVDQNPTQALFLSDREIDDKVLFNAWERQKRVDRGELNYIVMDFCSNGLALTLSVYAKGLEDSNYVSLSAPYPFELLRADEDRLAGVLKTTEPLRFFDSKFEFDLRFDVPR